MFSPLMKQKLFAVMTAVHKKVGVGGRFKADETQRTPSELWDGLAHFTK